MSLSLKSRTSSKLRLAIFLLNMPDRPLLGSFSSIVLFVSLHSTPYHKQWLLYGSNHVLLSVHSPPLADSWNSFRAFLSGGHNLESFMRSNPGKKQRFKGAGFNLWREVNENKLVYLDVC